MEAIHWRVDQMKQSPLRWHVPHRREGERARTTTKKKKKNFELTSSCSCCPASFRHNGLFGRNTKKINSFGGGGGGGGGAAGTCVGILKSGPMIGALLLKRVTNSAMERWIDDVSGRWMAAQWTNCCG